MGNKMPPRQNTFTYLWSTQEILSAENIVAKEHAGYLFYLSLTAELMGLSWIIMSPVKLECRFNEHLLYPLLYTISIVVSVRPTDRTLDDQQSIDGSRKMLIS